MGDNPMEGSGEGQGPPQPPASEGLSGFISDLTNKKLLEEIWRTEGTLTDLRSQREGMLKAIFELFSDEVWESNLKKMEEAKTKLVLLISELRRRRAHLERQKEGLTNPFDLFPEEVWERILENLMSSKDVLNVFEALPELQGRVLKNKYSWLMDKVIPFLHGLLRGKDVLNCRQVSRRWCHGVDNFLENHPHKKPYSHEEERITGSLSPPPDCEDEYFLFHRESGMTKDYYRPAILSELEQDLAGHPPERNPFVGRSLWLTDIHFGHFGNEHLRISYWEEALAFLRKYGQHIWFLQIRQSAAMNYDFFCRFILETLSLVPNLRGLKLASYHLLQFGRSRAAAGAILKGHSQSFPILPQLETLIMPCEDCTTPVVPDCLNKFLMINSSSTIRRLCLCPCRCWWFHEYSNPFPNLTDFTLAKCSDKDKEEVDAILRSMDASKLTKLELQFHRDLDEFLDKGDITTWLSHFPNLHTFQLSTFGNDLMTVDDVVEAIGPAQNRRSGTRGVTKSPTGAVSSIKSFQLNNCPYQVGFRFLACFPNLEYFKIHAEFCPDPSFLRKLQGPDLWELLPKLKELTLTTYEDRSRLFLNVNKDRFTRTRAKFEWLQKRRAEQEPIPDLEAIFESFTLMELGLWGEELADDAPFRMEPGVVGDE